MVFDHIRPIVATAEKVAATGDTDAMLYMLRRLSMLDFGMLHLTMPNPEYPALSRLLPRMASVETQVSWAGSHGYDLYRNTHDFASRLELHFERLSGKRLSGARILDYGCGFGRLTRMLPYFTETGNVYGIDPWDKSIELCRESGVLGQLAQSDYLPSKLPFDDQLFDLIFAYSVFTHTSKRATLAALRAIRDRTAGHGVFILTVRPVEVLDRPFWLERPAFDKAAMTREYRADGFTYFPYGFTVVDGDDAYGDCVIDPKWIQENCSYWQLVCYDRAHDHDQTILVFRPG